MKICWDNLERVSLSKYGNLVIDKRVYIEMDACKVCGEPYLSLKKTNSSFCSRFCASKNKPGPMYGKHYTIKTRKKISIANKGENNPMYGKTHTVEAKEFFVVHSRETMLKRIKNGTVMKTEGSYNGNWKGGVKKDKLPLYDTYVCRIEYAHEVRPVIKDNVKLLEVRCKNCNGWFVPNINNVQKRIYSLLGKGDGENNFYCSDECRNSCSVFGQIKYPKGFKPHKVSKSIWYTDAELRIWREEVLKRADYKCEYCGEKATIAHHSKSKKLEPFFALDPEYGVACCEKCHFKYGHQGECNTANLARIDCK